MNLILDIAWTHVRFRARQTMVAIAGVATGVGFSIMRAALMEGSQRDFVSQLVDSLPHITLSDERRQPPRQKRQRQHPPQKPLLRRQPPQQPLLQRQHPQKPLHRQNPNKITFFPHVHA